MQGWQAERAEATQDLVTHLRGPDRRTILFPTKMKLLLLLLCLGLTIVCIQAEEYSSMGRNFNVEQISGYWFSIAEASDEREKIEEHGSMRAFVENITVLENSLVFKFHFIVNEECTEMTLIGEETEKAA